MSRLALSTRLETATQLRTYATLLPLDVRDLDAAVAREAEANPWLEIRERPLAGLDGDEVGRLAARGPSLVEHLEAQLAGLRISAPVRHAAEHVIGSLDTAGYLADSPTQIAARAHVARHDAASAIAIVQQFEPAGCAARDLGERFRLQLAALEIDDARALALTFALDELAALGHTAFAARHDWPPDDVERAIALLRRCDPTPAQRFTPPAAQVYPELRVWRDAAGLHAAVDDRAWPEARVASFAHDGDLNVVMRTARTRARLVVDALARRRSTLARVAQALLTHQFDYFASDGDAVQLKPLTARELARDLGCAESTISRALTQRYVATPFGTRNVRSLIVASPGRVGLSTAAVRERIRTILTASPASSDEAVARALRFYGITLARRTVAKYRGELGLPSLRTRVH